MLYTREITDPLQVQFIILFALYSADEPLMRTDLINVVLDNCNVAFTDFQIALHHLIETDHAKTYERYDDNQYYEITEKGLNVYDFFIQSVPIYIKDPIRQSIKELFLEKRRREAVQSNIVPINRREYKTECKLFNDDKLQLLDLTIYSGTYDDAKTMSDNFNKHHVEIYGMLLKMLSVPELKDEPIFNFEKPDASFDAEAYEAELEKKYTPTDDVEKDDITKYEERLEQEQRKLEENPDTATDTDMAENSDIAADTDATENADINNQTQKTTAE